MPLIPDGLSPVVHRAVGAALLPARLAAAAANATLALGELSAADGPIRRPGGYAEMVQRTIGEQGYAEQVVRIIDDDEGPMRLAVTINELTAPDRPLGRVLARDGVLDRLLADEGPLVRISEPGGALDRLLAPDGPLDRILAPDGALDRLLAPGGALDRLTASEGAIERLVAPGGLIDRILEEEYVEKLVEPGGTLDQLVSLGATLDTIRPQLEALAKLIPVLSGAANELGRSVAPLGDIAGRIPFGNWRRTGVEPGSAVDQGPVSDPE